MTSKNTEKQLMQFLRERKLTSAFKRYKKIRYGRKLKIIIDGVNKNILVYKKNNKTIIADRYTLKTLATTKRFNLRNINKGFKEKIVIRNGKKFRTTPVKLKVIDTIKFKNTVHNDRTFALKKKVGKLFMSVTFIGKHKERKTVEGGSRKLRLLKVKSQYNIAFNEAFKGAWSQVNFSPQDWIINWVHYSYVETRK